ncbi:hypothetical protein D3C81_1081320 [compost metagenome]
MSGGNRHQLGAAWGLRLFRPSKPVGRSIDTVTDTQVLLPGPDHILNPGGCVIGFGGPILPILRDEDKWIFVLVGNQINPVHIPQDIRAIIVKQRAFGFPVLPILGVENMLLPHRDKSGFSPCQLVDCLARIKINLRPC